VKFQHFVKPEGSLPFLEAPVTDPHHEIAESSPNPLSISLITILILLCLYYFTHFMLILWRAA
jgi:hypothetical protein